MISRRRFLLASATAAASVVLAKPWISRAASLRIACQQYPWFTFFQREGRTWEADPDQSISDVVSSGFNGFEPSIGSAGELAGLSTHLGKHGVWMSSLYVNSKLHEAEEVATSIAQVMAVAEAAKPLGIKIVVTNPAPIRWGGDEDKTDSQLVTQAQALDHLGDKLRQLGISLAYHNHDAEMRQSAREFHHMLTSTKPENVRLCLDSHWVYRGSGNSQVALFDIVQLYADRIVELHLRQSSGGIWTETFGPGDIDYDRLAEALLRKGVRPHLVMEQAVEQGTPNTMTGIEAHRQSLAYAEEVFKDFS
jgi:inosose dehydratase